VIRAWVGWAGSGLDWSILGYFNTDTGRAVASLPPYLNALPHASAPAAHQPTSIHTHMHTHMLTEMRTCIHTNARTNSRTPIHTYARALQTRRKGWRRPRSRTMIFHTTLLFPRSTPVRTLVSPLCLPVRTLVSPLSLESAQCRKPVACSSWCLEEEASQES
jgi:hypothetical protein